MSFESPNNPVPPPENIPQPPPPPTEVPKHLFSNNPYEVLGISKTANIEQIEEAKRDLQRKYHPDVNTNPKATEAAKNINNAYDILNGRTKGAVLGDKSIPKSAPLSESQSGARTRQEAEEINEILRNLGRVGNSRRGNFGSWGGRQSDGREKLKNKSPEEMVTGTVDFEVGILIPSSFDNDLIKYGKSKNVTVRILERNENGIFRNRKMEFTGKSKDVTVVLDYIEKHRWDHSF